MKFRKLSTAPLIWNRKNNTRSDNDINDDAAIAKANEELTVHNISVLDVEMWDDERDDGIHIDVYEDEDRDDLFETDNIPDLD